MKYRENARIRERWRKRCEYRDQADHKHMQYHNMTKEQIDNGRKAWNKAQLARSK